MKHVWQFEPAADIADLVDDHVAAEGSGAHPHILSGALTDPRRGRANIADAAHFLCLLHGHHPSLFDTAAAANAAPPATDWLRVAAQGFAAERHCLVRLAALAGPVPVAPGHAQAEAAVCAQRRALAMLAQSERHGCALGAAVALALDWWTVRTALALASEELSLDMAECALPDRAATVDVLRAMDRDDAARRAIDFGARQLLTQHRALWNLLAARSAHRAA